MFKIYWKDGKNNLAQIDADGYDNHVEAIEATQQMLQDSEETLKKPLLALIQGGKK